MKKREFNSIISINTYSKIYIENKNGKLKKVQAEPI